MSRPVSKTARTEPVGQGWTAGLARLLPAFLPSFIFILAFIVPHLMFWRGGPTVIDGLGPGAWPGLILNCLAFFSAIWLTMELWALGRGGRSVVLRVPDDDEVYKFGKAFVGIMLIVLYGIMLQITGFALTTATFIALWCIYGGIRNPLVVVPVSLIGTAVFLWVFVGLALMPLSRGHGPFDQLSIWLLQALEIY